MGIDVDRDALEQVCRRYGVAEIAVFGSVARGTETEASDIDILYTLTPESPLGFGIRNLTEELSAVFGRPVDLVARRSLHPRLAPTVLAEARVLYAA